MQKTIYITLLLLGSVLCYGQNFQSKTYNQLDSLSDVYLHKNKLDSAIIVMKYAKENFPEFEQKTTHSLGFLYVRGKQLNEALAVWQEGHQKGYFYGLKNSIYKNVFNNNPTYLELVNTDNEIGEELDSSTHVDYEIHYPSKYDAAKQYPIIFIFHGDGRCLNKSKITWQSELLSNNFIVVFLQSYIHTTSFNFLWTINDEKSTQEITKIYNSIINDNSTINHQKIVFAGMSAGGMLALDFALNNTLQCTHLYLHCPVIPIIDIDKLKDFSFNNKELIITTGEYDFSLSEQSEIINELVNFGSRSTLSIIPNLGHKFPENFSEILDQQLELILR